MNQVQKEILEYIEKNDGAFYGRIAQRLRHPNPLILKNLIELKMQGRIYKDSDGGRYKLIAAK